MAESPEQHLLGVLDEDDEPLGYADLIFQDREHAKRVVLGYLQQGRIIATRRGDQIPDYEWAAVLENPSAWDRESPDRVVLTVPR